MCKTRQVTTPRKHHCYPHKSSFHNINSTTRLQLQRASSFHACLQITAHAAGLRPPVVAMTTKKVNEVDGMNGDYLVRPRAAKQCMAPQRASQASALQRAPQASALVALYCVLLYPAITRLIFHMTCSQHVRAV